MTENKLRVTYNSGPEVQEFNLTAWGAADGRWHQVAFSAAEDIVQVVVDKTSTTLDLPWTKLTEYNQVPFKVRGKKGPISSFPCT